MKGFAKKETLAAIDADVLLANGFEDALVGTVSVFSKTVALYDRAKCISILMKRANMGREEAEEFFEFNVQGAYVGETTPGFCTFFKDMELS